MTMDPWFGFGTQKNVYANGLNKNGWHITGSSCAQTEPKYSSMTAAKWGNKQAAAEPNYRYSTHLHKNKLPVMTLHPGFIEKKPHKKNSTQQLRKK